MAKKQTQQTQSEEPHGISSYLFPRRLMGELANEVAEIVIKRMPSMPYVSSRSKRKKKQTVIENALFLDTSAIIDGRIFGVIESGLISGPVVVPGSILLELKHIADSQDTVKRERGRNGLEFLETLRKSKAVKLLVLPDEQEGKKEVDEKLIAMAKSKKGKVVTCDYNLAKKASIERVPAINVNELANFLKVRAVPGESLHVKILHKGKDPTQGVGYLDDGTMIVVEHAANEMDTTLDVVVARVIQTSAGRILFAKKI